MVYTDMTRASHSASECVSVEDAATSLVERIEALDESNTGHFFHAKGSELPW
jgi:hypothetical protein